MKEWYRFIKIWSVWYKNRLCKKNIKKKSWSCSLKIDSWEYEQVLEKASQTPKETQEPVEDVSESIDQKDNNVDEHSDNLHFEHIYLVFLCFFCFF